MELELLDVDRCEDVILDQLLTDHDCVLEVVPIPRHESDEHVATERELSVICTRAVGDDVAGLNLLAQTDQWVVRKL